MVVSVRPSRLVPHTILSLELQNVPDKSCLVFVKSEKYAYWVTLRPLCNRYCRGEAEVHILDFETTWSEFQSARLLLRKAKPSYVYSILKPHGQSFKSQSDHC